MKKFLAIMGFVFGTINISFVFAENIKSYPGSLCEPYINSQNSTSYYPSVTGGLVNTSETHELKAVCPIILNIDGGTVINNVTVNVVDGHSTKDVKCILRAGSADSSYLYYGSTRSSTGTSRDVQTLSFADVSLSFTGSEKAVAIMHCEFPERDNYYVSYIKSYSAAVE